MTRLKPPVLALTMGDPAGIGPEIILKALADGSIARHGRPLVVGDAALFEREKQRWAPGITFVQVQEPSPEPPPPGTVEIVPVEPLPWEQIRYAKSSAEGGRSALAAVERAVALALAGSAAAVVTAPISKESIRMAGSPFPGHTEFLAHLTGTRDFAMMLVGGGLRVSLATIHLPLASVPGAITRAGLATVIRLTAGAVRRMGIDRPRVAVCGLNPHAGEGGIFGDEESTTIIPAIDDVRREGLQASGPWPADTVFHRQLKGDFDAVVAMYHDQGLGPLKTVAFDDGVNLTLGLPIIRASVDHGTAFDIAGRGLADTRSLVAAAAVAASMTERSR